MRRASVRCGFGLGCLCLRPSTRPLVNAPVLDCVRPADLHVEPQQGSSLSSQELMTRLCFLLGDVTHGTDSTPMEDRREKKVGQHIDSTLAPPHPPLPGKWMIYETRLRFYLGQVFVSKWK